MTTASVASTTEPSTSAMPEWRETRREPWVRFRDNPIAHAFARRSLRPTRVWPDALVISIIGSLMVWGASDTTMPDRDVIYRFALALFALPLVLVAPAVIASSIGLDRANGLLDFHRASPTTALSNVLGYIVGNGSRWILDSAIGLPFTVVISLLAGHSIAETGADIAMIIAYGIFYASIGAMAGVLVNVARVAQAGVGAAVPLLLHFAAAIGVAAGQSRHAVQPWFLGTVSPLVVVIPGVSMPAKFVSVVTLGVWSFFALRIAERRFTRETAIPFTRLDAVMFVVATTGLHGLHHHLAPGTVFDNVESWVTSVVSALGVAFAAVEAAVFALMPRRSHLVAWARRGAGDPLAPTAAEIANQGASIVPITFVLGLLATGLTLATMGSVDGLRASLSPLGHATGAAVLLPIIFVAISENSALRHPRNVGGWFGLSCVVLLVPLGLAALASMADTNADWSHAIASFSPMYLPFAGFESRGIPAVSWLASLAAIAFFSMRARSARRALVAQLRPSTG